MSTANATTQNVKPVIITVFGLFFILNVILLVFGLLVAFKNQQPMILPEDTGMAVRLLIFIVGVALSWALGRWLYTQLIDGEIPVNDSGGAAQVMLLYLVLLFAGLAFLNGISWIWQSVILLVLVLMTLFGLNRVIGWLASIAVVIIGLAIGAALFFFML